MSCEEIRELIAALSLGTATGEERALIEAHLAECALDHGIAEDAAVAAVLARSAPEMRPPNALKGRVMAAATGGGSVATGTAGNVTPFEPSWRETGSSERGAGWLKRLVGPYQVAAVLAVALVAMIAWNIDLQSQPEDERFVHYYTGGGDNWMRLETELGTPGAQVSLGGLERLQSDARYHLWATRGDDTQFVGVFNTSSEGQWAGEFDFTFEDEDRLWITAQSPSDGEGPQGEAVLRTRF